MKKITDAKISCITAEQVFKCWKILKRNQIDLLNVGCYVLAEMLDTILTSDIFIYFVDIISIITEHVIRYRL